ncbi:hypothetical protein HER15_14150 [Tenacibaculum mesophilum]|uniref:Uncharacterized protein n=1 Tax=Tenacibaculum mesophilum TaxID=104268 RepID=A0AAE9MRP8_9FLAO|nr:hypothetical protein [Tenacibaculum mesophilum]UTD16550.1 hypothetical protein HER15_14150 [Tenacibaculum mesophilum]
MGKSEKKRKSKRTKLGRKLKKFDRIILKSIPKLFEFLGWVAILGGLQYVSVKSGDYGMLAVYFISLLGFMFYIQVYIYNEFFKKIKTENLWTSFLSLFLSAVLGLGTFFFKQSNRLINDK